MKILIIDNYDSFTYNVVHSLRSLGMEPTVWRNDTFRLEDVAAFDKLIISPGPGIPSEAGLMPEVLRRYADKMPVLGICLGHQALSERFGATLVNTADVYHGVKSNITITRPDDYLFAGLPEKIDVGRYHSWVVGREGFPDELEITAESADGAIMALRHRNLDVRGLQFHPESVLTDLGMTIFENWLKH